MVVDDERVKREHTAKKPVSLSSGRQYFAIGVESKVNK
jgi:hypothetical protein